MFFQLYTFALNFKYFFYMTMNKKIEIIHFGKYGNFMKMK